MSSPITTHVLDTAQGQPAAGIDVVLDKRDGEGWTEIARGTTNHDGRITDLLEGTLEYTVYRLTFDTGSYFERVGVEGFYPEACVVFQIGAVGQHYHVPLLLSPYGYSTYRGS